MPKLTFTHRHRVKTLKHALTFLTQVAHQNPGSCKTFHLQGENWRWVQTFLYRLVCCKKVQSPASLNTGAISYCSCTTGFILITVPKQCELFPGRLSCTLCPVTRGCDFFVCPPTFPAASELGLSAAQSQAHPLLHLHMQSPNDPWKNFFTGTYQISMLSVPLSVLTLGFWGSWFPKRP